LSDLKQIQSEGMYVPVFVKDDCQYVL